MRRALAALMLSTVLCGCASTKTPVQVRAAQSTQNADFDALAVHAKAKALYNKGAYREAYSHYQNLLLRTPKAETPAAAMRHLEFSETALALAQTGQRFKNRAMAGYTYLGTLEGLDAGMNSRIHAGRVLLSLMDPQTDVGEKDILLALEKSPKDARLWNALGHERDQNKHWVEALEAYVTALKYAHEFERSTAPVVNNMGMSLLMQGRTAEALSKFESLHEAFPHSGLYENNYQLVLVLSGKLGSALEGVSDSRAAQLFNDAGYISAGRGETRRARSLYKKAIEYSPVYFEIAEKNLAALDL